MLEEELEKRLKNKVVLMAKGSVCPSEAFRCF